MIEKIGFIGMGNMATALAKGLVNNRAVLPEQLYAYDIDSVKLATICKEITINLCTSLSELIQSVDTLIIAVKPAMVEQVMLSMKELIQNKVILSLVFGYNFEKYQSIIDESNHFLYMIPNIPVQVGEGVILFEEKHSLSEEEMNDARAIFSKLGVIETLTTNLMELGGTMSSCAPAFIDLIIESLADGGVMHGLPRDIAYTLVSQTMLGTGKLQLETKLHPGQLKDMVCSPNGSTIRGIVSLEKVGLRGIFIDAIDAVLKH